MNNKNRNGQKGQNRSPKKITASYLHNAGLYYLERFSASKRHFKTVMMRKVKRSCMHHEDQDYQACAEMVDELVKKFESCGLLNDNLYAEGLVNSLRRKGLSSSAIITKATYKGIPKEQVSQILKNHDSEHHESSEEAELYAAIKLAQRKKIGPFFVQAKEQNAQKSLGILARAGFSYNVSKKILSMSSEEVTEINSKKH